MVEEYAHLRRGKGAAPRMLQHGASLLDGDSGEPLDELRYEGTIFEVLEERGDRHPGTAEHPRITHAFGVAFNSRAGRPIDHAANGTTGRNQTANAVVQARRSGRRLRREPRSAQRFEASPATAWAAFSAIRAFTSLRTRVAGKGLSA